MRQIPKGKDCRVSIWLILTTGSQAAVKVPGRFRMGPLSSLNLGYFELKIITIFDQRVWIIFKGLSGWTIRWTVGSPAPMNRSFDLAWGETAEQCSLSLKMALKTTGLDLFGLHSKSAQSNSGKQKYQLHSRWRDTSWKCRNSIIAAFSDPKSIGNRSFVILRYYWTRVAKCCSPSFDRNNACSSMT